MKKSSLASSEKPTPACPACGADKQHLLELLNEAIAALELCLGCPNLTWEAEQEAEAVYKKLKRGA